ncbi:hypothetical protein ACWD5V_33875 [Streptomyces sp. NPDC002523]
MTVNGKPVVGVIGLGKLGLPLAITLAMGGYEVIGHDIDPARMTSAALAPWEVAPAGTGSLLDAYTSSGVHMRFADLDTAVNQTDCVLVAVETPHEPRYEGITPLPDSRADFDYAPLRSAVSAIVHTARRTVPLGIISTVLPGTVRRDVAPLTAHHPLVYCPQFIAMGQVARDFLNPEFILIGTDSDDTTIESVFAGLAPSAPVLRMSTESAELTKVVYNTYISTKVAVSNLVQQLSDLVGADAADVFGAMRIAGRRLASPAYMGPGLGDGGPCHPRDNIALSWLAREHGLGSDLFTTLMDVRHAYMDWLADRFVAAAGDRPLVVLGTAYKSGVPIETGSAAVLLTHLLRRRGLNFTTIPTPAELPRLESAGAHAYFVGCPEPGFYQQPYQPGSLVFDPWHLGRAHPGVELVRPGSRSRHPAPQAAAW